MYDYLICMIFLKLYILIYVIKIYLNTYYGINAVLNTKDASRKRQYDCSKKTKYLVIDRDLTDTRLCLLMSGKIFSSHLWEINSREQPGRSVA